jgi:hypothetical protein
VARVLHISVLQELFNFESVDRIDKCLSMMLGRELMVAAERSSEIVVLDEDDTQPANLAKRKRAERAPVIKAKSKRVVTKKPSCAAGSSEQQSKDASGSAVLSSSNAASSHSSSAADSD